MLLLSSVAASLIVKDAGTPVEAALSPGPSAVCGTMGVPSM